MPSRLRLRDKRYDPGTVGYEQWSKAVCSGSAAWASYYTSSPNTWLCGEYTSMNDVTGNPPLPSKGAAGFVNNPMTIISQSIDVGTGIDWNTKVKVPDCSGADLYNRQYRRSAHGITVGRQGSGFGYAVNPLDGKLVTGVLCDPDLLVKAIQYVSTEVLDKRGRGGSQSNLYESIAEVDKTLALLSSYVDSFKKLYKSIKRKDPRAFTENASALYLMTRYGLMPTISDIQNILRALDAKLGLALETTRAKYEYTESSQYNRTSTDGGAFTLNGVVHVDTNITVRGWSTDQYERTLAGASGLSGKNLLTVPWELTKFSFVADWFVNIGSYLGSMVPSFGLTQVVSGFTVEIVQISQYDVISSSLIAPATFDVITPPSGGCTQSIRSKSRFVGLRAPTLMVQPNFKFDRLLRCLDALSLASQQVRR